MDIGQGGFMRTARALFVATIVAATIAAPLGGIARAKPSGVVVALRVRLGLANEVGHTTNECRVRVPAGANGIAVLKAAQRAGCIDSYVVSRYSDGTHASCIDSVCQMFWLAVWYLYFPESGNYARRLEAFSAGSATMLDFRYAPCVGGC
jgi:hypothetical protein